MENRTIREIITIIDETINDIEVGEPVNINNTMSLILHVIVDSNTDEKTKKLAESSLLCIRK
jgi:hypothetical protein